VCERDRETVRVCASVPRVGSAPHAGSAHSLLAAVCWQQVEGLVTSCLFLASLSGHAAGHVPRCVPAPLSLPEGEHLAWGAFLPLCRLCLALSPSPLSHSLLRLSLPPLSAASVSRLPPFPSLSLSRLCLPIPPSRLSLLRSFSLSTLSRFLSLPQQHGGDAGKDGTHAHPPYLCFFEGAGCRMQGEGFRVQALGCMVQRRGTHRRSRLEAAALS